MFKVVHYVRRGGVIGKVFLPKFACHLLGVILLFLKMIPYFTNRPMKFWSTNEFLVDRCLIDYLGAALEQTLIFSKYSANVNLIEQADIRQLIMLS